MSNRDQYMPGPAAGAEVRKDGKKWTLILVRELRHPERSGLNLCVAHVSENACSAVHSQRDEKHGRLIRARRRLNAEFQRGSVRDHRDGLLRVTIDPRSGSLR